MSVYLFGQWELHDLAFNLCLWEETVLTESVQSTLTLVVSTVIYTKLNNSYIINKLSVDHACIELGWSNCFCTQLDYVPQTINVIVFYLLIHSKALTTISLSPIDVLVHYTPLSHIEFTSINRKVEVC